MAEIIPIRDLKNTSEISELCQKTDGPIFITKNGYGNMVIMSMETYERDCYAAYVRRKLAEAEKGYEAGAERLEAFEALRIIGEKYGFRK